MSDRVVDTGMRVYYYDDRAAEYDDWWNGTGLLAARKRPGYLTRQPPAQVTAIDRGGRMVEVASPRPSGAR